MKTMGSKYILDDQNQLLDFINNVQDPTEICDLSQKSGKPDPDIDLSTAKRILGKRIQCANHKFSSIQELVKVSALDQNQLNSLLESISGLQIMTLEDVGDLEKTFDTYYNTRINSLGKNKEKIKKKNTKNNFLTYLAKPFKFVFDKAKNLEERRKAKTLMEDHLVLAKSGLRSPRGKNFIVQELKMKGYTLKELEDVRLIRKIRQGGSGDNPIYEVSHETLIKPILKSRRRRDTTLFLLKKYWLYGVLLLLLFFLLGFIVRDQLGNVPENFSPTPPTELHMVDLGKVSPPINWKENVKELSVTATFENNEAIGLKPSDSSTFILEFNYDTSVTHPAGQRTDLPQIPIDLGTILLDSLISANGKYMVMYLDSDTTIDLPYLMDGKRQARARVSGKIKVNYQKTRYLTPVAPVPPGPIISSRDTFFLGEEILQADSIYILNLTDPIRDFNRTNLFSITNQNFVYPPLVYELVVLPSPVRTETKTIPVYRIPNEVTVDEQDYILKQSIQLHTVKAGEGLFSIAKKYGIHWADLRDFNGLKGDRPKLIEGQILKIPPKL